MMSRQCLKDWRVVCYYRLSGSRSRGHSNRTPARQHASLRGETREIRSTAEGFSVVGFGTGRVAVHSGRLTSQQVASGTGKSPGKTGCSGHKSAAKKPVFRSNRPGGDRLAAKDTGDEPTPKTNTRANKCPIHIRLPVAELAVEVSSVGRSATLGTSKIWSCSRSGRERANPAYCH